MAAALLERDRAGAWRAGRLLGLSAAATLANPYGAGLHLQVDPALWDKVRLAAALAAAGGREVSIEAGEPSLEDVFLAALGQAEKAA